MPSQPAASPFSTGGGGVTLEQRYGAGLLSYLLTGAPASEFGGAAIPVAVRYQAAASAPTDDYLMTGVDVRGDEWSSYVAVRNNPTLTPKNPPTVKLIRAFLETLDAQFEAVLTGRSWVVLASSVSSSGAQQLRILTRWAQDASVDNGEFREHIATPHQVGTREKQRLEQIDAIVSKINSQATFAHLPAEPAELTWFLLSHLRIELLDLEGDRSPGRTVVIERLIRRTSGQDLASAEALYTRMVELSGTFAATAASVTSTLLESKLDGLLAPISSPASLVPTTADRQRVAQERSLIAPTLMRIRTDARRSLGLLPKEVERSFAVEPPIPAQLTELAEGALLVLRGPIGSGKTDLAASWLMQQADQSGSESDGPIQVWLRADEIGSSLVTSLIEHLGVERETVEALGIDLVIDGLDERPGAFPMTDVQRLLVQSPHTRVVFTSRESETLPSNAEVVDVPAWSSAEAETLIAAIVDRDPATLALSWPAPLRDAVRRPLFALLAAHNLGSADATTPAGLVARTVERALRGGEQASELRSLAVALTRAGRPVDLDHVPNVNPELVRSSRLVIESDHRVRFSLPIFEQWFAAQAVLQGSIPLDEVIGDIRKFARWRYVLAVAVSCGTHEGITPLLAAVARWNPGAASWVLREANSAALDTGRLPIAESVPEFGEALITAISAWEAGLGPLAAETYPFRLVRPPQQPTTENVQVIIASTGQRHTITWTAAPTAGAPQVVDGSGLPGGYVQQLSSHVTYPSATPSTESWVWDHTLGLVSGKWIGDALKRYDTLTSVVPNDGMVQREYRDWLTLVMIEQSEYQSGPLPAATAIDAIAKARSEASRSGRDFVIRRNRNIPLDLYGQLEERVSVQGDSALASIWPSGDLGAAPIPLFSVKQMEERVNAVFEGAAIAYEEIARALLPKFVGILTHSATFPATMEGQLRYDVEDRIGDFPSVGLSYWFAPDRSLAKTTSPPLKVNLELSANPYPPNDVLSTAFARLSDHRASDPLGSAFESRTFITTGLRPDFFGRRPATHIAVSWLIDDLNQLGWATADHAVRLV